MHRVCAELAKQSSLSREVEGLNLTVVLASTHFPEKKLQNNGLPNLSSLALIRAGGGDKKKCAVCNAYDGHISGDLEPKNFQPVLRVAEDICGKCIGGSWNSFTRAICLEGCSKPLIKTKDGDGDGKRNCADQNWTYYPPIHTFIREQRNQPTTATTGNFCQPEHFPFLLLQQP